MALIPGSESFVEESFSPKKGIVFEGAPETTLDDYLESVSKTIDPDNITHASLIFGDRVCMFFREESHINELIKKKGLDVKNTFVPCKPFVESSKVILSNCLPFISKTQLEDTLSKIGKLTAPITDIPVNTNLDNFRHVKSFRKTTEILFPDLDKVPNKVMVEYCTKKVPIYICVEDLLCSECQRYGHCAAYCTSRKGASKRKSEVKTVPKDAKKPSSPIASFLYRHAANFSLEPAFTNSIDISRESIWSVTGSSDPMEELGLFNDAPDSGENRAKLAEKAENPDCDEKPVFSPDYGTFLTFLPPVPGSQTQPDDYTLSLDYERRSSRRDFNQLGLQ